MKKRRGPRKVAPRLPTEVVLRLGSFPQTTKKGEKGYDRGRAQAEAKKTISEEDR